MGTTWLIQCREEATTEMSSWAARSRSRSISSGSRLMTASTSSCAVNASSAASGDVEETVTTVEMDEETDEEIIKRRKRTVEMLFVRGDGVILVSPPVRTN